MDWPLTHSCFSGMRSIDNYIDVQECATHGMKIEVEDQAKELKMADGAMVKIEGRV